MKLLNKVLSIEKNYIKTTYLSEFSKKDIKLMNMNERSFTEDQVRFLENIGFKISNKDMSMKIKRAQERIRSNIFSLQFDKYPVISKYSINKLANKYYLLCQPIQYYQGKLPNNLPLVLTLFISEFELKQEYLKNNLYIIAPVKQFFNKSNSDCQAILVYKISDNQFKVIHSWGNSLAIYRTIVPYFLLGDENRYAALSMLVTSFLLFILYLILKIYIIVPLFALFFILLLVIYLGSDKVKSKFDSFSRPLKKTFPVI